MKGGFDEVELMSAWSTYKEKKIFCHVFQIISMSVHDSKPLMVN